MIWGNLYNFVKFADKFAGPSDEAEFLNKGMTRSTQQTKIDYSKCYVVNHQ